jgi:hypothetical protein
MNAIVVASTLQRNSRPQPRGLEKMPNAIHVHLMINHAPLFGELFALSLLAAAGALRNRTLLRTALLVVLITGLASIPVFFSGRRAADAIGKVEGIDQEAIDPHEEAAERFLFIAVVASLAAVAALVRPGRATIGVAAALTLLALGQAGWTAMLGGLIHHNELRHQLARGVPLTDVSKNRDHTSPYLIATAAAAVEDVPDHAD